MILASFVTLSLAQGNTESSSLVIARVKYQGGGDWYNDPSAIPNLCAFVRVNTHVDIAQEEAQVSLTDEKLFSYPFLFLTGHGQLSLSDEESIRLRTYLLHGGFLYTDDDYGLDETFRKAMKKVFPSREMVELPFSHGIYSIHYRFDNGLPKIHEHDNKPPQGFGIFDDDGRLMVFYTYETNISDGWVDPDVYEDPPEKRDAALKMGTNILIWALLN
ncbi:DUF4159 domain-containing protein [bacterium]|nr:DUF4159 domain-containing protein [bacterium]RQV92121.1 MAG: DUF4159 domain-containing protein [bacterium]